MANDILHVLGFKHELTIYDIATGEVVDHEVKYNLIPQAGIDFLIQTPFGDVAPIPAFYCGLFRNNVLPTSGMTAADIPTTLGEFVNYAETSRPAWNRAYNLAGTQDNSASKAVFTPTAEANVYGSFMVANPTKGSNTGLLLSVVRFSTVKPLSVGLEAKLVCGLTYIPTNSV